MLDQKINIASFDHHVAESLLAAYSSSGHGYKRLKVETKIFQYGAPEITFLVERSGEEPKRYYNFDIAVNHYNEIEIEAPKMKTTDDGTPIRQLTNGCVLIGGNPFQVIHADHLDGNGMIRKKDHIYMSDKDEIKEVGDILIGEEISHGALILRPLNA